MVLWAVAKIQFESKLDTQLGARMAQLRAKIPQFGAKMAPRPLTLEPRGPQDLSTWSQDGPKMDPRSLNLEPRPSDLEPRWPQDPQFGAKTRQLEAKMAPRCPM